MKKAIIDIDGVLNYYPTLQIHYFNECLDSNFKTLAEIKKTVSYIDYKIMKENYRRSVYKHEAEPQKYAKELLQWLRDNGYLIYIVTARPLFKHNQLERTILWLRNNGLVYDYIYCSQKKDFTIFEKFGFVDFVIDDNCDNIDNIAKVNNNQISSLNNKCYYFNTVNNDNRDRETTAIRVHSLEEVLNILNEDTKD